MKKTNDNPNMKSSVDFYNFCTVENQLPILKIISERFVRCFRVSASNWLRMICTINHSSKSLIFSNWVNQNSESCCMFIIRLNGLDAPILIKLDQALSYGMIDALAGGQGKDLPEKKFTTLELKVLKEIGDMIVSDLNEAWKPVEEVKAQFVRTEISAQFVGIIPQDAKVISVKKQVEFGKTKGLLEILYPYSTLFPVRDKLFAS